MPSLTQIRDAAAVVLKTALRAACPDVKEINIRAFSGELTLDTAKSKAFPTGTSVLVAALEAENVSAQEQLDLDGTFAVLVVVSSTDTRERREARALAVAELATVTLHGNTFGLADVGGARVRSLAPISDESLDKASLSVWSVVWQQGFTFSLPEATA